MADMQKHLVNPNDDFAKKNGFPSAAAMQAFYANRQKTVTSRAPAPSASDLLDTAASIHPAVLFKYILDKYNKATGQ